MKSIEALQGAMRGNEVRELHLREKAERESAPVITGGVNGAATRMKITKSRWVQQDESALRLQAAFRGKDIKDLDLTGLVEDNASERLQAYAKGVVVRQWHMKEWAEDDAASRIQGLVQGWSIRRADPALAARRVAGETEKAFFMGQYVRDQKLLWHEEYKASEIVQGALRGHHARRCVPREASSRIQAPLRGHIHTER